MGIEHIATSPVHEPDQVSTGIKTRAATWALRPIVTHWAEIMGAASLVEYDSSDFGDKYIKAIQDGCIPILITNHSSDFDAVVVAYFARLLTLTANEHLSESQRLKALLMITSNSLRHGKERPGGEKIIFDALEGFLAARNIEPVFVTTQSDRNRRHMLPNSREFMTTTAAFVKSGQYGIFLFPEATVDSGRIDPETGERKGMRRFVPYSITTYVSMIKDLTGRDCVIIPAAIADGWRVYDHQTSRPTLKALRAGLGIEIPGRGLDNTQIASMRVGDPIRSSDESIAQLINGNARERRQVETYFAKIIAGMLPPAQRGIYG